MFIVERIWVKKSAVSVHSTSTLSDGSMPRLCILRIGGMPCRMFISIGTASETCAPTSLTFCQAVSDMPVMWMNRLSGPIPMWPCAARSSGERVEGRADAERREDVRRDLQAELAPDRPGLRRRSVPR